MSPVRRAARLRLYHHRDGARVAYREMGTGPALGLLHSALLSHREFEPVIEHLGERFRVVLPDLPLHGDSEDRPRHPYTPAWFAEVMAGVAAEVLGPRPLIGGHGVGAQIVLHAVGSGQLHPERVVLMSSCLHRAPVHRVPRSLWRLAAAGALVPGLDRVLSHGARMVFNPRAARHLSVRDNPQVADLVRHAFADVGGNSTLARSWARAARRWPAGAQSDLLDIYPRLAAPVLLLWADQDERHPLEVAEEARDLLPDAQLRVLDGTGFLMAYDDPVGLARELAAFCG